MKNPNYLERREEASGRVPDVLNLGRPMLCSASPAPSAQQVDCGWLAAASLKAEPRSVTQNEGSLEHSESQLDLHVKKKKKKKEVNIIQFYSYSHRR